MKDYKLILLVLLTAACLPISVVRAQSAFDFISRDRNFSASNYCIYPDSLSSLKKIPPPPGKKPFYISHYGRHGSRYLSNRKGYDIPYKMLCKADNMDELTPIGQEVMQIVRNIINDSEGRWGDLSGIGVQQHHNIARRMIESYPEVFHGNAHVDAYSTNVSRCILSMGSFIQQMVAVNPELQVSLHASRRDMYYLNHQDRNLRDSMMTPATQRAYDSFSAKRERNPRLMELLFVDPDSVRDVVEEPWLNYYLLKTALIQQNTHTSIDSTLLDLFTYEEIHHFWQRENAWWYFMYGPSPLNGGKQPYTQRYLLRKIIADADSCIMQPYPGATLRFGHETVLLPLACLLGINGFDFQTYDLEELEGNGWWACLVLPMASNIQFVFYRSNPKDKDVIFKVLLNEQEATLPIQTDIAPYYHWRDFRNYYIRKLDLYDMGIISPASFQD